MRKVSLIILFFVPYFSYANCVCKGALQGNLFFKKNVLSIDKCKDHLNQNLTNYYKDFGVCKKESFISLQWQCNTEEDSVNIPCDEINKDIEAYHILFASNMVNQILTEVNQKDIRSSLLNCYEEIQRVDTPEPYIQIAIDSKSEMRKVLGDIITLPDFRPGSALDRIEDNALSFYLLNDNVGMGILDKPLHTNADDIGRTHAIKIKFSKSLKSGKYIINLSYATNLHTSYLNPYAPTFYYDGNGSRHIPQYFLEENIGKVFLKKVKEGKASYWTIGAGVQELNFNDTGRSNLISAISQQSDWHNFLNSTANNLAPVYQNFSQPERSRTTYFIDASRGENKKLWKNKQGIMQVGYQSEIGAKASTIDGASHIHMSKGITLDSQLSKKSRAYRAYIGAKGIFYQKNGQYRSVFVDLKSGKRNYMIGLKFEKALDQEPLHLRPYPLSIDPRNIALEKTLTVYYERKW